MNKISVCVPFYPWYREHDRTEEIFQTMIPSMLAAGPENFELSIVDGGVRDIWGMGRKHNPVEFELRLRDAWPGDLKYVATEKALTPETHETPNRFWLPPTINMAVKQSSSDWIFINNMDIEIPLDFAAQYWKNVDDKSFFVARCYNLRRDMARKHEDGGWRSARGLVGMSKEMYWSVNGTDEKFIKKSHDSDLYNRLKEKYQCNEILCRGLFHIDHPGTNEHTSEFIGTWKTPEHRNQKADLMIVCAHPDDEGIFFGGAAAYYSRVKNKAVVVVCMTGENEKRRAELEAACRAYGCKIKPVCLGLKDINQRDDGKINMARAWESWGGRETAFNLLFEQVEKYRPEVILGHDLFGEGYHSNHATAALVTVSAFDKSRGVKKLYLHLYKENPCTHLWNIASEKLGGKTPEEFTNLGLLCHVTQHKMKVNPNAVHWGFAGTRVGPDLGDNDFFQNISTNFFHDIINQKGFKRIAEVGVLRGAHAATILDKCAGVEKLYLVDPWADYATIGQADTKDISLLHQKQSGWDAIAAEVKARFNGNPIVQIIREKCTDAMRRIPDGSLDAVYDDADHTYKSLMADIECCIPKIRKGGVMAGHDYDKGWPDVMAAVNDCFGDRVMVLSGHQWMVQL